MRWGGETRAGEQEARERRLRGRQGRRSGREYRDRDQVGGSSHGFWEKGGITARFTYSWKEKQEKMSVERAFENKASEA